MRILGVDPGSLNMGFGVIEIEKRKIRPLHYETLKLGKEIAGKTPELHLRFKEIHRNITEIIKAFRPDSLAIEELFFYKSFQSAVRLGESRAIVILAAAQCDLPVYQYPPTTIKKAIVGSGGASKQQMQFMVRHLLGLKENPQADSADALAIAICHCHTMRYV